MDEILRNLPAGARVLDLGCDEGSFPAGRTRATTVRLDRDVPGGGTAHSSGAMRRCCHLPARASRR